MSVDHVFKLYSEAIRSPYVHNGFWDDPSINIDDISLNDVIKAQERYIEHLSSFIPKGTSKILDVGAGIGRNSLFLRTRGFNVDALSPDEYREHIYTKKYIGKVKFFNTKLEDFASEKKYDLILQSDSVCYILIDNGRGSG
jgi:Tellurite resistance protein TehB.